MRYETTLSLTPPTATAQHHGERVMKVNGRYVVKYFMKPAQRRVRDNYMRLLAQDIAMREDGIGSVHMFNTAVIVEIDFMFPHTANTRKRDKGKTFPKITRPDVDNMAKGLLDCICKAGIIQDDGLIFDLRLRKFNVPHGKQGVRILVTDELYTYYNEDNKEPDNGKIRESK